jgi:hypothetical protein
VCLDFWTTRRKFAEKAGGRVPKSRFVGRSKILQVYDLNGGRAGTRTPDLLRVKQNLRNSHNQPVFKCLDFSNLRPAYRDLWLFIEALSIRPLRFHPHSRIITGPQYREAKYNPVDGELREMAWGIRGKVNAIPV